MEVQGWRLAETRADTEVHHSTDLTLPARRCTFSAVRPGEHFSGNVHVDCAGTNEPRHVTAQLQALCIIYSRRDDVVQYTTQISGVASND